MRAAGKEPDIVGAVAEVLPENGGGGCGCVGCRVAFEDEDDAGLVAAIAGTASGRGGGLRAGGGGVRVAPGAPFVLGDSGGGCGECA
jgi:hypothetical protein